MEALLYEAISLLRVNLTLNVLTKMKPLYRWIEALEALPDVIPEGLSYLVLKENNTGTVFGLM